MYDESKQLYDRAVAIHERALGPNHPDLAIALNNLALLLKLMVRAVVSES